jgi:hypothetical protein
MLFRVVDGTATKVEDFIKFKITKDNKFIRDYGLTTYYNSNPITALAVRNLTFMESSNVLHGKYN